VLAVDLDGFKSVNDTFGHAAGDALLTEVATRLLAATRGSDVVARLGGDEFAILVRFLHDSGETTLVAERILRSIETPITLGDRTTDVGVSIGIAQYSATSAGEGKMGDGRALDAVDALIHDADVALYHAKTSGKGCWSKFDPSMHDAAAERRALQADLRLAMTKGELQLIYQPIVYLATGATFRLEALLRWTHPIRGSITPAEFIPLAEESGLIIPLGRWVLETACRQLAEWQRGPQAEDLCDLSLAVNVSGRQLQHAGFVAEVDRILQETGVEPRAIVLELTESAVIHQADLARDQMRALKKTGVRLAIDDFGTGYSSLAYLQHYPIDVLKIDKSFVKDVANGGPQEALVRTIIWLGKALSLETVGEGIETEEQRVCLQAMGCDCGQGYLFARPQPPSQLFQAQAEPATRG
jgi:diguanylate cyclase (GGDEF)-like protein